MVVTYPPEPWDLHGHAYVGVWLIRSEIPSLAPDVRPVRLLGRTVVGTAFFVYEDPSPLNYGELMATVLVRDGWRLRVTIIHIWVDSPASREGGRALWAIPKELATFEIVAHSSYTAPALGTLVVRRQSRWNMPMRVRFSLQQSRHAGPVVTPVRGRIRVGAARGRWTFLPSGVLGFLQGRPVVTLRLDAFRLLFGRRAR